MKETKSHIIKREKIEPKILSPPKQLNKSAIKLKPITSQELQSLIEKYKIKLQASPLLISQPSILEDKNEGGERFALEAPQENKKIRIDEEEKEINKEKIKHEDQEGEKILLFGESGAKKEEVHAENLQKASEPELNVEKVKDEEKNPTGNSILAMGINIIPVKK